MIKTCEKCGEKFEARENFYKYCPSCFRAGPGSGKGKREPPPDTVPAECIFTTFYTEDGYPKRELYIDSAEKMTSILEKNGMTMSQLRSLFHMLKSASNLLKSSPEARFGDARKTFHEFVRQVDHQNKRGHVPAVFVKFVRDHLEVATKNAKEFDGFVEYLTSILARIKQK